MISRSGEFQFVAVLLLSLSTGCGGDEAWRERLGDPDPSVRRAAIRDVASKVGPTAAVPVLTPALADADEKVQVAAALALLEVDPHNADCRPVIERALSGGQGPVFIAVGATGEAADWAVPTLVQLLSDRKVVVRALAAKTLGEIGVASEAVDAALRRGLRDNSPAVRNASRGALDRLHKEARASASPR